MLNTFQIHTGLRNQYMAQCKDTGLGGWGGQLLHTMKSLASYQRCRPSQLLWSVVVLISTVNVPFSICLHESLNLWNTLLEICKMQVNVCREHDEVLLPSIIYVPNIYAAPCARHQAGSLGWDNEQNIEGSGCWVHSSVKRDPEQRNRSKWLQRTTVNWTKQEVTAGRDFQPERAENVV